ncbi:MAG: phosphate signaling complex protein PhoU [Pseudomonadota bacterium]|nr:phosphate signaling complex protein PhoU [Pseudomonadota bacterium]
MERLDRKYITQHTSRKFNQELEDVRNRVLAMGGLVEKQLDDVLRALCESDFELAERVVKADARINAMEVEIDEECGQIIARRQPAASDLRLLMMVIKTITDLERIGDQAKRVAHSVQECERSIASRAQVADLRRLGERVSSMLRKSLDAYARVDVDGALRVIHMDGAIDEESEAITRNLMTFMMEDPRQISPALNLLWCTRSLERMADHAKNICEYIVYMVEGRDVRHVSSAQMAAVERERFG